MTEDHSSPEPMGAIARAAQLELQGVDRFPGDLPDINQLVELWGRWERWVPSRVEDRRVGRNSELLLAVAAVSYGERPRPGDRVRVRWVAKRGVGDVDGTLSSSDEPPAFWRVLTDGTPMVTQRRRFARTPAVLPIELTVCSTDDVEHDAEGPPPAALTLLGTTVDLSEGGLQCVVRGVDELPAGTSVIVNLSIAGRPLHAVGMVQRMHALHDGFYGVVLAFDLEQREADLVRRFVFDTGLRSVRGRS